MTKREELWALFAAHAAAGFCASSTELTAVQEAKFAAETADALVDEFDNRFGGRPKTKPDAAPAPPPMKDPTA